MNTKNLKPFDLDAALKGEPVMLRDGRKAFVRHHETELPVLAHCCLWGIVAHDYREAVELKMWSENGLFIGETLEHSDDIIGMYPKTRIINGFEVPAPETKVPASGTVFFVATPTNECIYSYEIWSGHRIHRMWLERGLIFLRKEDAIANSKAMLGINPYDKVER